MSDIKMSDLPVVIWQYRYNEQNKSCVGYGEWSKWIECDIVKFNEINIYISQGYKYETRKLIVKVT